MKKLIVLLLAMSCLSGYAQKKTAVRVEQTQARLLDIKTNAYVKPLTVEVKINEKVGRFEDNWALSKEKVEEAMNGEISNVRSYGIYKSTQKYGADLIVGATFHLETDEKTGGYILTVIGYPANFVNWNTATEQDYEWIKMEKVQTTSDKEKISAIIK